MLAHRVMMGAAKGKAPDELSTAVFRWYDASQIAGLSDGDPVSQWDDESVNADHAVQATGSKQPTYKTGIINGWPVVRFDGGDVLEFSEIFDSSGATAHMFVVADHTGGTAGALLSTRPTAPTNAGWTWRYNNATQQTYFHTGHSPLLTNTVADQFNILEIRRDGLDVEIGANGTLASSVTISGYSASSYGKTSIGAEAGGAGSFLTGDVPEIAIYSSLLSAADRLALLQHFKAKYGIS